MAAFRKTLSKLLIALAVAALAGCASGGASPTHTPTEAVAAIASTPAILRAPTPTAWPGIPEDLQTFADPLGRFTFDFPASWFTMAMPDASMGITLLDARYRENATQWIELWVGLNPNRASLPVWVAEHGAPWPGQVVAQEESWVQGRPVLRQRLEGDDSNLGGRYVYALVWMPAGEEILLWTAWPGDRPETLNLLERLVWGVRFDE